MSATSCHWHWPMFQCYCHFGPYCIASSSSAAAVLPTHVADPPHLNRSIQSAMLSTDNAGKIPLVDMRAEYRQHGHSIVAAIGKVAEAGTFILGPQVAQLENELSQYLRTDDTSHVHCVTVSDGTAALQLSLMALGIRPGNEVITVPFTWISSAEVIPLVGATPVFIDVERDTYLMDVSKLSELVTPRTRAVIAVSLFGLMPDLKAMREVLNSAEARFDTRIAIIEDAAQSFGAYRHAYPSCASPYATMATTSFFPTKPLSCYGDGGAVFTRNDKLAATLRALRVHGKVDGRHQLVGLNSRLDTVQAAVLLAKLSYFDEALQSRRTAAETYNRLMSEDGRIVLPTYDRIRREDGEMRCVYAVYTVQVQERDAVVKRLRASGVSCGVYYAVCCHSQPVFKEIGEAQRGRLATAEMLSNTVLSLPMHAYLSSDVQVRIVRELRTALDDLQVTQRPL